MDMRRATKVAWRLGWRLAVAGAAVVGIVLLASLGGVDRAPHPGSDYAVRTEARLRELAARPDLATLGELRAGFGRAKLTPTLGTAVDAPERGEFRAVPLAGYGQREGRPATGVHDDVWVKAFAFAVGGRTGVVVAADALIIPREVSEAAAERIRAECGLDRGRVYFGATHTHCSLGGWGEGWVAEAFAGGFQPGVRVWMARQLAAAATAAVRDLGPATVGGGSFPAPEFTRNRLVGDQGRIDPEFALLVVRKEDGRTGVLGSYAAHATVLPGRFMEFSGDYPGFWQRRVEERTGGMAAFLAGGVGSHSPKPPEADWRGRGGWARRWRIGRGTRCPG
jgi:neutral ceramidase